MGKDIASKDLYKLIDRFEASSLSELEVETDEIRISMRRQLTAHTGPVIAAAPAVSVAATAPAVQAAPDSDTAIYAHLVGSFYRAPAPDAEPFVEVGRSVKKGDVVGIIEAMKVMHEVNAPCDGVITSIEVDDGSLVEYQQLLMKLEASDV